MAKRNKVIYWIVTAWLALGMLSTGIVQILQMEKGVANIRHLGYPLYILTILGVCKILGVGAVLVSKFPILKEWAYAGFFFAMSGALVSHLVVNDPFKELFGPALLLVLTVLSWYLRPENRKVVTINKQSIS